MSRVLSQQNQPHVQTKKWIMTQTHTKWDAQNPVWHLSVVFVEALTSAGGLCLELGQNLSFYRKSGFLQNMKHTAAEFLKVSSVSPGGDVTIFPLSVELRIYSSWGKEVKKKESSSLQIQTLLNADQILFMYFILWPFGICTYIKVCNSILWFYCFLIAIIK